MRTIKTKAALLKANLLNKQNGDSQIVVALVLIAVAIGLCIIFRNQIFGVMGNLFNQIGGSINDLANGAVTQS